MQKYRAAALIGYAALIQAEGRDALDLSAPQLWKLDNDFAKIGFAPGDITFPHPQTTEDNPA